MYEEKILIARTESAAAKRASESVIERCKAAFPYQEKFSVSTLLTGYSLIAEEMVRIERGSSQITAFMFMYPQ